MIICFVVVGLSVIAWLVGFRVGVAAERQNTADLVLYHQRDREAMYVARDNFWGLLWSARREGFILRRRKKYRGLLTFRRARHSRRF